MRFSAFSVVLVGLCVFNGVAGASLASRKTSTIQRIDLPVHARDLTFRDKRVGSGKRRIRKSTGKKCKLRMPSKVNPPSKVNGPPLSTHKRSLQGPIPRVLTRQVGVSLSEILVVEVMYGIGVFIWTELDVWAVHTLHTQEYTDVERLQTAFNNSPNRGVRGSIKHVAIVVSCEDDEDYIRSILTWTGRTPSIFYYPAPNDDEYWFTFEARARDQGYVTIHRSRISATPLGIDDGGREESNVEYPISSVIY